MEIPLKVQNPERLKPSCWYRCSWQLLLLTKEVLVLITRRCTAANTGFVGLSKPVLILSRLILNRLKQPEKHS